jgi:hypothetical protein
MDFTIAQWIVDQTGVALFAGFALFITYRTYRDAMRRECDNGNKHREDKLNMLAALQDVARTNTELCQLIRSLREDMRSEK